QLTVVVHRVCRSRKVVGREDGLDAWYGHRRARIEASHSAVRVWTQQELREEHALRAKVLGVLALARDFRNEVGSDVVLSDELLSHVMPSACSQHRASAR